MRVVVPFDAGAPKTRLSPLFDAGERAAFARVMLEDVLGTLSAAGYEPTVLATEPVDCAAAVEVDERPLTPAVNAVLEAAEGAVAVVMADLPLATPTSLDRLFGAEADLAVAPGRAAGTNAFVARHPEFRVDYHGTSFVDHLAIAESVGASVEVVDSHRLATDVDERADLVEVLVHGEGTRSRGWLLDRGVELTVADGRVGVERD
ncbi:MAG: 2-phospho-L-lactate guanylyltransferase [Halobacteriales archaeon]|nr:2-phospho-L-lactate guanylyltransferase [Halobacteriales archaeon]